MSKDINDITFDDVPEEFRIYSTQDKKKIEELDKDSRDAKQIFEQSKQREIDRFEKLKTEQSSKFEEYALAEQKKTEKEVLSNAESQVIAIVGTHYLKHQENLEKISKDLKDRLAQIGRERKLAEINIKKKQVKRYKDYLKEKLEKENPTSPDRGATPIVSPSTVVTPTRIGPKPKPKTAPKPLSSPTKEQIEKDRAGAQATAVKHRLDYDIVNLEDQERQLGTFLETCLSLQRNSATSNVHKEILEHRELVIRKELQLTRLRLRKRKRVLETTPPVTEFTDSELSDSGLSAFSDGEYIPIVNPRRKVKKRKRRVRAPGRPDTPIDNPRSPSTFTPRRTVNPFNFTNMPVHDDQDNDNTDVRQYKPGYHHIPKFDGTGKGSEAAQKHWLQIEDFLVYNDIAVRGDDEDNFSEQIKWFSLSLVGRAKLWWNKIGRAHV